MNRPILSNHLGGDDQIEASICAHVQHAHSRLHLPDREIPLALLQRPPATITPLFGPRSPLRTARLPAAKAIGPLTKQSASQNPQQSSDALPSGLKGGTQFEVTFPQKNGVSQNIGLFRSLLDKLAQQTTCRWHWGAWLLLRHIVMNGRRGQGIRCHVLDQTRHIQQIRQHD